MQNGCVLVFQKPPATTSRGKPNTAVMSRKVTSLKTRYMMLSFETLKLR
jgi:hypothetical protein